MILIFFVKNKFIRGFCGDMMIVIMIYFCAKIIYDFKPIPLSLFIIIFSFSIEFIQIFTGKYSFIDNFVFILIFGSVFDPYDLLAYVIGVSFVYFIDTQILKKIF